MQRHRALALGAYLVGATLILLPLFDASISIAPVRLGDVRWRFAAAGLLANALLIPNAGLLLVLITAINYGHATFRRVVGVCAFIAAAFWLAVLGMFALDAIQARATVRPDMSLSFNVASWSAVAKMLAGTATLVVLGLVGIRDGKAGVVRSTELSPLFVVGQEPPAGKIT